MAQRHGGSCLVLILRKQPRLQDEITPIAFTATVNQDRRERNPARFSPGIASYNPMGRLRIKPILETWGRTLRGQLPSLSLEITHECPLRCPGCYAYEDAHLGTTNLRSLSDFKGQDLIRQVLELMDKHKPLHLSIVGGDPLVRYRELDILLPELVKSALCEKLKRSAP